jgi:CheY-like chemotaxis protein
LEGIFGAFSQIEGEHQRRGLGLGLALVRSLVDLHGGEVHAHSEGPGRGSEFCLYWPLAGAPRAAAPTPAAATPEARRRVLVVDDNADIADAFATLLRALGHEVTVAYNGEAGLAMAREHRPEVAFLDLGMPGMDGVQLAERLHQSLGQDCPLLVAVTGHGQPADRERTRAAGFHRHVLKPAGMQVVREVLGELAGR